MSANTVRCLMCGMSILSDAKSYERHIEQRHSMDGYSVKIKPVNTSGRTKAQIVQDMEKGVLASFVTDLAPRPVVTPALVAAAIRNEEVPETFCLAAENVCVWEKYGMEICGPCEVRKEYLATMAVGA